MYLPVKYLILLYHYYYLLLMPLYFATIITILWKKLVKTMVIIKFILRINPIDACYTLANRLNLINLPSFVHFRNRQAFFVNRPRRH